MPHHGPSAYDQPDFFENFLSRRNRSESPNNAIEEPVLLELFGDPAGKHILDLGCGDARFGAKLLQMGAASFEGVEGSLRMAQAAEETLAGTGSRIHHAPLEDWPFPAARYDLVLSRMVFHYIPDIAPLFGHIRRTLKPGGRLLFSVQHPVLTSSQESARTAAKRSSWITDDYFRTGKRTEPWIGEDVIKYHRTAEDYFSALVQAGFTVDALREGAPNREHFSTEEEYERRLRIPLFLLFACRN